MEFITEFFWFCVKAVFWYWVISLLVAFWYNRAKSDLEQKNEIRDKIDSLIHRVKIEYHGDTCYWFDDDSGAFLGQGKTADEIVDHVRSRFPTHLFFLPEYKKVHAPDWKIESYELSNIFNLPNKQ